MVTRKNLLVLPTIENIEEIIGDSFKDIDVTKGHYYNLEFQIKENIVKLVHRGVDIKDFSMVWLSSFWRSRDLAYAIQMYLEHFKIPHTYVEKNTSKITDQLVYAFNGIKVPDTFFIDQNNTAKHIDEIERVCGYPMIIKDIRGSRGKNSVYVKDREELLKKISKLPKHKKYYFQKFVENDFEWGVLVVNGEIVSAERSYRVKDEFRNNAKGTKEVYADICDVPKSIQEIAIKATEALGLSWSRADIISDKYTGVSYLLEVNRCPGISSGTDEVGGAQQFLESHINLLGD